MIKAILILPGTVLVFVPAAILLVSRGTPVSPDFQYPMQITFVVAMALIATGAYLAITTARRFTRSGQGTPAPWDPPRKLVIAGPYRCVRNPMIGGVILMLLGETVLFNSWPLFLWTLLFLAGKMVYLPRVEEKELLRRFGAPYRVYMDRVPRWIPRFKRWEP
jgi:protein-S-isoprenylcysteine O-methyltransferase Ste14